MKSILFIAADSFFAQVLTRLLVQSRYRITQAHDATEGMRQYRQTPSDLVMIDLFMPAGEDLTVIRNFKQAFPHVKLIALSGKDAPRGPDVLQQAREMGVHHTFRKPFNTEELLAAIQAV